MPFLNNRRPVLMPIDESGERTVFVLVEDCTYHSQKWELDITVPKGTMTDGASVPRDLIAWNIAGGFGLSAAVLHDFMYRTGSQPKDVADGIFLEAMIETGVPEWRAIIMHDAVVEFGASSYKGKKESIPQPPEEGK